MNIFAHHAVNHITDNGVLIVVGSLALAALLVLAKWRKNEG